MFALKKRNHIGLCTVIGLCVLEIKTKFSENIASALAQQVMAEGRSFLVCNAGTEEFKLQVPDNAYRLKVCQHEAALGLSYVIIVYSTPSALPKKVILVHIFLAQRKALSNLQEVLANKFMSFAYNKGGVTGVFPDLGDEYSASYGYAQEHHIVNIWLRLWREHTKDIKTNGTPTSCWNLLDLAKTLWNKLMGNVDTVRKVVKKTKTTRGPNSGPGSLMWYIIFDYIFITHSASINMHVWKVNLQRLFQ